MDSVKLLKIIIVCHLVGGVVMGYIDFATQPFLPEVLRCYRAEKVTVPTMVQAACTFQIVLMIASLIGLWILWWPARLMYSIAIALGLAIMPFYVPTVLSGGATALNEFGTLCEGLILGLLYFSELGNNFKRQKV